MGRRRKLCHAREFSFDPGKTRTVGWKDSFWVWGRWGRRFVGGRVVSWGLRGGGLAAY